MKKCVLIIAVAFAAGYVLGARSGRETARYARDQAPILRDRAQAVAKDVADKTVTAARDVRDRTLTAATDVASRVGEARDNALEDFDDES